jgi:very-short-patch-repair endonuclease
MDLDHRLRALAERQHGLVTVGQTVGLGATEDALRHRRTDRRDWELLTRRVLRLEGSPRTPHQAALAAVLDSGPGAVLSHGSAAALWGLSGHRLHPAHVSVVRGGSQTRSPLAVVHRPRALPDRFVTGLDDIPVVRPELLVLQACATMPRRAERVLDGLWSLRLLSGPVLRDCLDELAVCGRPGIVRLRELLDDRGVAYVPPASGLEARFAAITRGAGLPAMERQANLGDDEAWTGRVDFFESALAHIVEVDSERYHAALVDRRADEARQLRLEAAGFTVTRVADVDVWHRPHVVIAAVRAGRQRALQRRRQAS